MFGGSGTGSGSGTSFREENSNCNELSFITNLRSPVPTVLRNIRVDDQLTVDLDPNSKAILAYHNGQIAGAITSSQLAALIKCMGEGHAYIGIVQSIEGGNCTLLVQQV